MLISHRHLDASQRSFWLNFGVDDSVVLIIRLASVDLKCEVGINNTIRRTVVSK